MKKLLSVVACVLLAQGLASAQEKSEKAASPALTVEKIVVATSVENREPVGENTEFEASVGTVYCWTKITASTTPATIKHVWYLDDKKVFEIPLELKYASTRTWSSKSVQTGKWKVEVTDDAGTVLSSLTFTVK
ncbi:MAG: DUF2914 domain-containing protein [Terriglobia bacterium]|jgi:hypothetical protein